MKKIPFIFYTALVLFLGACSNEATDKPTTEPVTTSPPATPPAEAKDHVEVKEKADTPKTEISIGQKGGSVKTKKGTDVSVDEKGLKVGTKDVKIDIKTDTIKKQ